MSVFDTVLLAIWVVINLITFSLFGIDKHRAQKNQWRIPEKTLLLWSACFGGIGGYAGMQFFRHKTKHASFTIPVPLFAVVQIVLVVLYILYLH